MQFLFSRVKTRSQNQTGNQIFIICGFQNIITTFIIPQNTGAGSRVESLENKTEIIDAQKALATKRADAYFKNLMTLGSNQEPYVTEKSSPSPSPPTVPRSSVDVKRSQSKYICKLLYNPGTKLSKGVFDGGESAEQQSMICKRVKREYQNDVHACGDAYVDNIWNASKTDLEKGSIEASKESYARMSICLNEVHDGHGNWVNLDGVEIFFSNLFAGIIHN